MPLPADPPSFVVRQWEQIRRGKTACGLALVILLIQGVVSLNGGTDEMEIWYQRFGLRREGISSGQVWQLLTYGLLHGGMWHVGVNAMLLLGIGSRVEAILGSLAMLRVALLGVLVGGLGHLLISDFILVGVSGGCLALLILLTTLSPESRMFPLPVSAKSLGLGIMIAEACFVVIRPTLGIPFLKSIGEALVAGGHGWVFQVSHACHIGGGVVGWLYGRWLLRSPVSLEVLQRQRAKREK